MTYLVFDLILALIIIFGIFIGVRKGAVKIFLSLLAFITAILLANYLSTPIASFINKTYFEPKIIKTIETSVDNSVDSVKNALPDFIVDNSDKYGITFEGENIIDAEQFVTESISPIIEEAISTIAMFVLFIVFVFVLNILVNVINKLVKISFLGKINKFLGSVFGALSGCAIVIAVCLICEKTATLSGKGLFFIPEGTLESSYIYNFLISIF